MHLVQILLPLRDKTGSQFHSTQYDRLAREFTEMFGGVTAFTRSPAQGRWKGSGTTHHDDIIVLEVMTAEIDRAWWADLRTRLENEFRQEEIVIRVQPIELL
ncbi:MAG: hypothetical protein R3E60_07970 [Alphaproteobacteria bacterium]